jgi:hypothetical protein
MNKNEYTEILDIIKKRYENGVDNYLCNCYMDYMNNYISLDAMFDNELSHFVATALEYDRMFFDFKELMCVINILCKMANNKSYFDVTESMLKIAL